MNVEGRRGDSDAIQTARCTVFGARKPHMRRSDSIVRKAYPAALAEEWSNNEAVRR